MFRASVGNTAGWDVSASGCMHAEVSLGGHHREVPLAAAESNLARIAPPPQTNGRSISCIPTQPARAWAQRLRLRASYAVCCAYIYIYHQPHQDLRYLHHPTNHAQPNHPRWDNHCCVCAAIQPRITSPPPSSSLSLILPLLLPSLGCPDLLLEDPEKAKAGTPSIILFSEFSQMLLRVCASRVLPRRMPRGLPMAGTVSSKASAAARALPAARSSVSPEAR